MKSYKSKWINEGKNEGYLSAMAQILEYKALFHGGDTDDLIIEFGLKRKDFLNYLDIEDIIETDKNSENMNQQALNMWLS